MRIQEVIAAFKQWREVLAEERKRLTWRDWAGMLWLGLKIPFTFDRKLWRQRMLECNQCPIFDASLRRCRPFTGSEHGCGCFMPFKAAAPAAKCWARENCPDAGIGWTE